MYRTTLKLIAFLAIAAGGGLAMADGIRSAAAKFLGDYGDRPMSYSQPLYYSAPMTTNLVAPAPAPVVTAPVLRMPDATAQAPNVRRSFSYDPSMAPAPTTTPAPTYYVPARPTYRQYRDTWNPSADTKILGRY